MNDDVVILGDLHFGQAKSEKWTEDNQKKLIDTLYEYCLVNKITRIIQCGDFFDNRKALKHNTLQFVRVEVVARFAAIGVHWDVIVGNHDMFYKTNVVPNACEEILSNYENFTVHNKPTTIKINDTEIDLIPWICQDNHDEVKQFIKDSNSFLCVGHFELAGFKYNQSIPSDGTDCNFLEGYHKVLSGHFHTQSDNGTVYYVGTPYHLNFNDADDKRGFWILNTGTMDHTFVDSGFIHYTKVTYGDEGVADRDFTNQRVRLSTAVEDDNFKLFVSQISEVVNSLDIVYTNDLIIDWGDGESEVNLEDTRTLVVNTINNLEIEVSDKEFITKSYDELYSKAME
ncbi:nuclease [Paraglaciecola Antarctic GD virus 1]|nr:nuclease [Paraglaciecola Antarctic GD virus 1]